jgi:hypothetical protein
MWGEKNRFLLEIFRRKYSHQWNPRYIRIGILYVQNVDECEWQNQNTRGCGHRLYKSTSAHIFNECQRYDQQEHAANLCGKKYFLIFKNLPNYLGALKATVLRSQVCEMCGSSTQFIHLWPLFILDRCGRVRCGRRRCVTGVRRDEGHVRCQRRWHATCILGNSLSDRQNVYFSFKYSNLMRI